MDYSVDASNIMLADLCYASDVELDTFFSEERKYIKEGAPHKYRKERKENLAAHWYDRAFQVPSQQVNALFISFYA